MVADLTAPKCRVGAFIIRPSESPSSSPESRPGSTSYTILVRSKTQSREKVKPPFQSNQKSSLPIHSKHTVLYSSVIFTFCTCIENVIRRDTIKQNQNYVLFSDENEALDL